jgi:hypothetical protein
MKPDAYTKFILTVIALCLVVLAWDTLDRTMAPEAHAQMSPEASAATMTCKVPGNGYKKCMAVIIGK